MNLKKLVAALSAVTMLGSMTVAVPANAAETGRIEYSELASFRANGGNNNTTFNQYYYFDSPTSASNTYNDKTFNEVQAAQQFGVFMHYDLSSFESIKPYITSAQLVVTKSGGNSGSLGLWTWDNINWRTNGEAIASKKDSDIAKNLITALKADTAFPTFGQCNISGSSNTVTPLAETNDSNNKWTFDITNKVKTESLSDLNLFMTTRYYDTSNNNATAGNGDCKPSVYIYGDNRPYITYTLNSAKVGSTQYANIRGAYDSITSGSSGTIDLVANDTFTSSSDRVIVGDAKTVTINGNNKTIVLNGGVFEVTKSSDNVTSTLNISNVTISNNGTQSFTTQNGGKLNATNVTVTGTASVNGGANGTFTNSTIYQLNAYGNVTLVNTNIETLSMPGITNNDKPKVNADNTSSIGSATVEKIDGASMPYVLFTGVNKPANVTVPSGYFYDNSDGKIYANSSKAASRTVDDVTYYYASLNNAFAAASSGETITLLNNVSESLVNGEYSSVKDITIDGSSQYAITGSFNLKNNAHLTLKDVSVTGDVHLETGTLVSNSARNTVTLNNADVSGKIETDAYREYPRQNTNDINMNGIIVIGNSSVGSIDIGVVTENNQVVDTLDISGYTGSTPLVVNVKPEACKTGVNFFTGSDYKVMLDSTTANSFVLSGTALADKSSVGYYAFSGTTSTTLTKAVFVVTDTTSDYGSKYKSEINLGTQITAGDVLLAVKVTGLVDGVTINSVTLE